MCAVCVVVVRVVVVVVKVPAVNVIDVSVAVVVLAIARNFVGVGPHVCMQVLVVAIDSRVDDPNEYVLTAGLELPGLGTVNVLVVRAPGLAGVVHAPKLEQT